MRKLLLLLSLVLLSSQTIMANITMTKDGSRGIADIFSAKTVKGGRLFFGASPNFTMDNIGVKSLGTSGDKNNLTWDMFPKDRNTETFSILSPTFLGYGWNDYSTTTLGLTIFRDAIDKYDALNSSGVSEFYVMQKFTLPTADTVFNVGLVGQVFISSNISDGVITHYPESHYRTIDNDSKMYPSDIRYKSLSAKHSDNWALKMVLPITIDISAKNPDVMLKFHLNGGFIYADPYNYLDTKIFGNIGAEFDPHPTFGLYTILNGGVKSNNVMKGYGDIFKDDMSFDFGFNIKGPHVSFTAGAKKAISVSPSTESGDKAYYDLIHGNEKALKSSTNASLYYKEAGNNTYLINSPVPPEWTISTQLAFYLYLVKKDRDGDGIYDNNDMCPDDPEDMDGFQDTDGCPDLDNDGDGIPDLKDRCPNKAEDVDGFQDTDGCPDLDNDNDGIPDVKDKCPGDDKNYLDSREDMDGFQDNDGCPDLDNDNDGIPDAVDKCPNQPEDKNGIEDTDGCPDGGKDSDKDGILDKNDKCPNEAEDMDGFKDNDGCPDLDNDKDGIPDMVDKCPGSDKTVSGNINTKENYNGVEDTDGCPDGEPDTDGDGIKDSVDKCPKQPEDIDGFEDKDGCPDLDNDLDGIKDKADGCPGTDSTKTAGINTKETFNGYQDVDGCPDKKPTPKLTKKPMKLAVYFSSGSARLKRNSYTALDDLITKLLDDKKAKIIVEGYTDSKGSFKSNQRLSKRRADAVRTYLIKEGGISHRRIKAIGRGERNPIADNSTAEGRELNRRIEVRRR